MKLRWRREDLGLSGWKGMCRNSQVKGFSTSASVVIEWIVVIVRNVLDVTTVLSPSSFDELLITELDSVVVGTEGVVVSLASTGIVWTVVVSISEDDGVGPQDLPPPM